MTGSHSGENTERLTGSGAYIMDVWFTRPAAAFGRRVLILLITPDERVERIATRDRDGRERVV